MPPGQGRHQDKADRFFAADLRESPPLEERTRSVVALPCLNLKAVLSERAGAPGDFGEQGRADPHASPFREDRDVALGERLGRAFDEAAGDGLLAETGKEERETGSRRSQGMAEVRDLRSDLRVGAHPNCNERLEVLVRVGRRNDELRELEFVHGLSSFGEVLGRGAGLAMAHPLRRTGRSYAFTLRP